MFRNIVRELLSSTAFANPGAAAMASYKQTPDPAPLVATVAALEAEALDADEILKYARDIASMVPYWDKTDAIVEGYDAVRAAADTYLPKFADEDTADYNVRLNLTKFTNVYRDIVESLAAKPFEEEILLDEDVDEQLKTFCEDVDGTGNNLTVFGSQTFFNGINSAIDWIFVDYPTVDRERVRTVADQKAAGIRPFWSHVLGRNVREVRTTNIGGKQVISYIRIFEPGVTTQDRVRIFERVGDVVTWRLFERSETPGPDGKYKFVEIENGTLTIKVIPLIPFITGRRDGASWKVFPAMQDAADLQIKLYQAESALEFITTMAGYPMLAANGLVPEMGPDGKTPKKVRTGPMRILWGIPDNNGNHGEWKFIEPNASSMEFLQKKIDKTKEDLRELGRQPLTATSGNLTVITTAVAAGKAKSAVSAWALMLKDALENALKITAMWLGLSDIEPEVNVYNEFDSFTDGNNDLDALNAARDRGDLSRETYWKELKRRKVLAPEFDAEDEADALLKELPGDPDLENEDDNNAGKNAPRKPGDNRQPKPKPQP